MQRLIRTLARCLAAAFAILNLLSIPNPALSAETVPASVGAPRMVNVTSDSMPGWLPSVDLEAQARKTAIDYMANMDSGKYAEAYAFLADVNRKDQPFPAFADRLRQFNAQAGVVLDRHIVTVTWTNNPAKAPLPGVYVALDLVSRFANIDRHCGYLVLYQAPSGGPFQVMREEDNFLDNAMAASIAQKSSPAEVDATWATLSSHCPNYRPVENLAAQPTPVAPSAPLPEAQSSTIGYPTVDAALEALHAKAGVVFTTRDGWTIANDAAADTLWSFPPPGNPAYPAAVKRQVVEQNGTVSMKMEVLCGATKQACDDLVRSFVQLNDRLSASMRSGH